MDKWYIVPSYPSAKQVDAMWNGFDSMGGRDMAPCYSAAVLAAPQPVDNLFGVLVEVRDALRARLRENARPSGDPDGEKTLSKLNRIINTLEPRPIA